MTTRSEDIWICTECSTPQGRHDQWFNGDICEKCNEKMENTIPTAEEFMTDEYQIEHYGTILTKPTQAAIEFAKLHVKAALKKS
jgi:hypothetical protein